MRFDHGTRQRVLGIDWGCHDLDSDHDVHLSSRFEAKGSGQELNVLRVTTGILLVLN